MYISPCAAHYYQERLAGKTKEQLEEQRAMLEQSQLGIDEERAELEGLPGPEGARLRIDLERDAQFLRAKLAAVENILAGL